MSAAKTAKTQRRTQEQRSAETRALLLDAAIESLVELGYTGTTTIEVAARAGVSRGAQLHHFPTKQQLVAEAVQHLFERRRREFRALAEKFDPTKSVVGQAIDVLWSFLSGKTFYAWLEFLVAARTDSTLLASVSRIAAQFQNDTEAMLREMFALSDENAERFRVGACFVFCTLEGMAIGSIALPNYRDFPTVRELLKGLSEQILTIDLPKGSH